MAVRFRFLDEQDVAQFGDGWWVWDEQELTRIRGRDLMVLEELVDMPLAVILRDMPRGKTLAIMAAMWLAMHRADAKTGPWVEFNPAVSLTRWEEVPEAPLGSGEDPAPDGGSSTIPEPSTESATS